MKIACIYHSIDLDGFMSAAIVKHWFLTNNKEYFITNEEHGLTDKNSIGFDNQLHFIGYNYGQQIPDLSEYNKVIMCDISFPVEKMDDLRESKEVGNFIWLDHHISAIQSCNSYSYGIRDTKFAACELTWFYMNNPINNAIIDLTSFNRYEEKWIIIDDIYSISNYGRLLSKEREVNHVGGKAYRPNKILKHIIDTNGYSRVTINGVSERVHKLVAKYFLSGVGETVNHIDGNKENNCVSNLEYASYKENNIHAIENGLRNSGFKHWQSNTVEQYKNGELIKIFGSTNEAAKETGISQGNIAAVCRYYQGIKSKFRNRTQAGGFVFKYKDEVKEETKFERSNLKRIINIGSILSKSDSLELDSTEKEIHKFFNIPEIVRLLGRYDCFGHKGTEEEQKVLEFQYGARQVISNYEEAYNQLMRTIRMNRVIDIWEQGKTIYSYLCQEAKQVYKNGFKIEFVINQVVTITGDVTKGIIYKFICINKERFNPINFDIDYHKEGYDGCACFHYANGMWNFSLYNDNGLVDCSIIAKQFGGGGHKGASGFRVKDINLIFNNEKINYEYISQLRENSFDIKLLEYHEMSNELNPTIRKFLCFNKKELNSDDLDFNYNKYGYDGISCFYYNNDLWTFKIFSNNESVDCSVIAGYYTGTGNKNNAEFKVRGIDKFLSTITSGNYKF